MVTGDCYNCHIGLVDNQVAVCYFDLDFLVVSRSCLKVLCLQIHLIGASIGALGFRRLTFLHDQCHIVGLDHSVAFHTLLAAVVGLGVVVTGDCYNCHIGLLNYQQTIRAIHNNVIVINALFTNGAFIEGHIIPSGICALTMRRNSFEYSSGIICRIAINRFQLAVIGLVAAVGLEGYILVQFENNHICRFIRSNCDTLGFIALQRITLRSGGRYSNLITKSLSRMHSAVNHLIVPLVHHSIAQVAALAPASGKGNVMIRHCEEAVCVDRYILSGPAAENVACQFRSFCSHYFAVYGFR